MLQVILNQFFPLQSYRRHSPILSVACPWCVRRGASRPTVDPSGVPRQFFRRPPPILPASHADPSGDVSGTARPVRPPILPASLADPFSGVARPAADPLVPGSESADDVEVCWCCSLKLFSFRILSPPAHGYRLLGCPFRLFRTRKG